jgi:phage shock protein PspC (stress-responsive transcriptional regulator)
MQKVIAINLNGRAFQLDEDAYDVLRAYLDAARLALKDNPDLAEIMADLEQAIGEKCQKFLGPHKTVVAAAEVRQVLDDMGPVDGTATGTGHDATRTEAAAGSGSTSQGDAPKRLYQIHQGAMLSGVCQGIAAYLNVDVTLVRIIFVALAIVTKGAFALVYLLLMYVIPPASTSEEHAAAHGAPFNAREIIDQTTARARQVADEALKGTAAFTADWRHQRREQRRQRRRERREWKREWRASRHGGWWWSPRPAAATAAPLPVGYGAQVTAGVLVPVISLLLAAIFWIWAAATMSLLVTGAVFGRDLPAGLPLWVALVGLILLFNFVAWPLHHARYVSRVALGGHSYYGAGAWDGMMSLGFWILCGWAAYQYIPDVHQFFNNLPIVRDRLHDIFQLR